MSTEEQAAEALDAFWTEIDQGRRPLADGLDIQTVVIVQQLHSTLRPPVPRPSFVEELRSNLIGEVERGRRRISSTHPHSGRRSLARRLLALTLLLAALVTVTPLRDAAVQAAGGIIKGIQNAEAGLTDRQREAIHEAAHERNDAFLRAFVGQHRDPRSLPPVWVETYAALTPTLHTAAEAAQTIVYGHVDSTTFSVSPSGGLPIATSRIRVRHTIKGTGSATMTVIQLGGPVAHESNGALAEIVNDELVLPGDDVVLLLHRTATGGPWHTLPGSVFFVNGGEVTSQSGQYYHLNGVSRGRFLQLLSEVSRSRR